MNNETLTKEVNEIFDELIINPLICKDREYQHPYKIIEYNETGQITL